MATTTHPSDHSGSGAARVGTETGRFLALPFSCYCVSDLHIEHAQGGVDKFLNKMPATEVLVLAGDIGSPLQKHWLYFLKLCSRKYTLVLFVPGNHEHWGPPGTAAFDPGDMKDAVAASGLENVFVLHNTIAGYKGVTFVGTTLWTALRTPAGDPVSAEAMALMNDFKFVPGLDADTWRGKHREALGFLQSALDTFDNCVVVTHHAPDFRCIAPVNQGDPVNGLYASALTETRLFRKPSLRAWVYGHTHHPLRERVGGVLLLNNPGRAVNYELIYSLETAPRGLLSLGPRKHPTPAERDAENF